MTETMLRRLGLAAVLAVVTWVGMGCEGSGGGGDGGFDGTWAIYDQTAPGSPPWYIHFQDSTYFFSENEGGSEGVSGTFTYTVTDGLLVGPFTNPGTGDGRIEATITDDTLNLNFIEYWHDPYNVVPYTGTRM